jgi:hypothetical protein
MPRSTASFSVDGARRNGNRNQSALVSVEAAFDRALHAGGLHVSDGSLYQAEPSVTIELIEEVTAKDLPFTAPTDCTTHVRVTYSEGSDRYVSFSPRTYEEKDDYHEYLVAELGRVYLGGVEVPVWQDDEPLAEALEEWTLGLGKEVT